MWLVVGLGNPGRKYQRNRHNIGFRVVDELVRRHGFGAPRQRFGGDVFTGALSLSGQRHKALCLQPLEFMNLSGHAVQRTAHFYDLAAEDMIVIHDELDIDFGRLKLKRGGGHGGHNGLRSIIQQLGSRDFFRVRVGIGKPGDSAAADRPDAVDRAARGDTKDRRVVGHVLSNFPSSLDADVEATIDRAADATEMLISDGLRPAMNKFHSNPS